MREGLGLIIEQEGVTNHILSQRINVCAEDKIELTIPASINDTVILIHVVDGDYKYVKYDYDLCPYCESYTIQKRYGTCSGCGFPRQEPDHLAYRNGD